MLLPLAALLLCAAPAEPSPAAAALARGDVVGAIEVLRREQANEAKYAAWMLTPRYAWQDGYPGKPKLPPAGPVPPEATRLLNEYRADPERRDILGKLADAAMGSGHPELLVEAILVALNRGTWLADAGKLRTIADVRNYLYRACMLRQVHLVEPLLGAVATKQDLGVRGRVSEAELLRAYFDHAPEAVIFQLSDVVLSPGGAGEAWIGNTGEARLTIWQTEHAARITGFHLEPALCTWEVLRGERTEAEPCRALHPPGEVRAPEAEQLRPEVVTAEPTQPGFVPGRTPEPEPTCRPRAPRGPVIAFTAVEANAGVVVKQWDGESWRPLGTPRGAGVNAGQPALALGPDGQPALAYVAATPGGGAIYFERWTGQRWEQVGGSAEGFGVSGPAQEQAGYGAGSPSLAIDCDRRPTIAWQQVALEGGVCCDIHVRVRRYDGGWKDLGRPASGTGAWVGTAGHPALVLDGRGAPIVFWNAERNGGGSAIQGKRWSGSEWGDLAGSANGLPGSGHNGDPSAAVNGRGEPVVVWPLCPGIAVRGALFDGEWHAFGGGSTTCGSQSGLAFPVTVDSSNWPVVVFLDGDGPRKLRVQRFQRDRFVELGTIEARADAAAISRDQGGLVVAWSDYATRVHVMRWDGRAWIRLGDASGAGRFAVPAIISR